MAVGLTYTRGQDRGRRHARREALTLGERLLIVTSCVTLLAIALAYTGRVRAEAWSDHAGGPPVNLNTVADAAALEAPLSTVFTYPADRRFAAGQLAAHLLPGDDRRVLPNVGALARIPVPAEAIDRERGLVAFAERLRAARQSAAEAGREPPPAVSLVTAAELAAVKPSLVVRTRQAFRSSVLWCAIALVLSFHLVSLVWRWRGAGGDRVLLALAHLLVGVGFVLLLSRPDPLRDTLLLSRFTEGVVIGVALFGLVSLIDLETAVFRELSYVPLAAALVLSLVLIAFGSGPGSSSAKVNLGPVQPIEGIRLLLALFLAGYFARTWERLRQLRTETIRARRVPGWIDLPRLDHVLPLVAGVAAALALFVVQRDLGPALLLSLMFLAMFAVARRGAVLAGAGLALLVAGVAIGHLLGVSSTLAARLGMWQSPWDNAVRGGDQVAHALWALAAGAVGGTGAGLGHTRFLPEGHTDLALAAVGEELGLIGLLVVGAAFALIAWRGVQIARRASNDYRFFLALAMTLSLAIPVLVMGAGVLGVLPLTGVVTPFLSYGGSAMAANFAALGLLVAIGRDHRPAADLAAFAAPVRWLARAGVACAGVLLAVAAHTQTLRADEVLVRPQLGLQADGGRRFQFNPRVLDALAAVPRGTILDRQGLPLATGDRAVLRAAAARYERLGVRLAEACPDDGRRCYPAGAPLFHVLGDANTRLNWAAGNTSYVERDAEPKLRGFDDRAAARPTRDHDGRPAVALRRDYAAIVPLVRHRYQPDHPDVQALLDRSRDVRITIDARLQLAVAAILSRAVRDTAGGRGAVVVLEAATGEVLASVSYPFGPEAGRAGVAAGDPVERAPDALIDRARYGLYPPGSTFKMVTAAAALREDPALVRQAFTCQRLPSGRVGTRIRGIGPVHDDLRDAHPHGRLQLPEAIVRSCNAYFAQLAVVLGSEPLARTAAAAGMTLNTSRAADRVQANLPHAGYGQGEVVVTPLRLARVAAALGSDGTIREAPIVSGSSPRIETPFVAPAAARTLAASLRDAVVGGTGRLLKNHPARIAGKTGTAEVDDAPSHAWFAGFAPHGPASRRIAFAVVLEHAGYGGGSAAAVAGQVASAAAALGWGK
jgi:cell division protein FtsW (lipid II flippase)